MNDWNLQAIDDGSQRLAAARHSTQYIGSTHISGVDYLYPLPGKNKVNSPTGLRETGHDDYRRRRMSGPEEAKAYGILPWLCFAGLRRTSIQSCAHLTTQNTLADNSSTQREEDSVLAECLLQSAVTGTGHRGRVNEPGVRLGQIDPFGQWRVGGRLGWGQLAVPFRPAAQTRWKVDEGGVFDAASHDGTLLTTQVFFGTDGAGTCKLQPGTKLTYPGNPISKADTPKAQYLVKGLHFPSIQLCQAPAFACTNTRAL
ncbi:uncharacterized protein CLUP02_05466 [Colletotrichum lupini]|uniref:Uncharacterized protein n=1 Tax=Colletotrichum lupini TaxID=145971 RepID=A0A9Q8WET2_9PEZI|nr:uncharacterized protein CLUP02_05466 [Colletotrichum lupini]UQC79985.1 hypothetical protein CLUP02_05466 [Colletotrichum lupini]